MAGGHYALIEFQPEDDYSRIRQGLQAIQMEGYWPILAHAERCRRLAENVDYVEELVRNELIVQWPIRVLCKDDCKGICSRCGANLNIQTCDCDTTGLDPRMAAIKDIFSKFKEV